MKFTDQEIETLRAKAEYSGPFLVIDLIGDLREARQHVAHSLRVIRFLLDNHSLECCCDDGVTDPPCDLCSAYNLLETLDPVAPARVSNKAPGWEP